MPDITTEADVDLFGDELPLCATGKRPCFNSNYPDASRLEAKRQEQVQVVVASRASIAEEMTRQACELEWVRGAGSSRHAATTEETTPQVEGGQTQTNTGAYAPNMSLFDPYAFILLYFVALRMTKIFFNWVWVSIGLGEVTKAYIYPKFWVHIVFLHVFFP